MRRCRGKVLGDRRGRQEMSQASKRRFGMSPKSSRRDIGRLSKMKESWECQDPSFHLVYRKAVSEDPVCLEIEKSLHAILFEGSEASHDNGHSRYSLTLQSAAIQ